MAIIYKYKNIVMVYNCNRSATPANVHLDDLSLLLRLNVHTYVGPLVLVL